MHSLTHTIISFFILTNMSISYDKKILDKCILRELKLFSHEQSSQSMRIIDTTSNKLQQNFVLQECIEETSCLFITRTFIILKLRMTI